MKAYQPIKDSMGGSGPMPLAFLDKTTADLWAKDHQEEWTNYKVKEVEMRRFTDTEGAVGDQLVQVIDTPSIDAIRARALKKLTKAEREALGLQNATAQASADKPQTKSDNGK